MYIYCVCVYIHIYINFAPINGACHYNSLFCILYIKLFFVSSRIIKKKKKKTEFTYGI